MNMSRDPATKKQIGDVCIVGATIIKNSDTTINSRLKVLSQEGAKPNRTAKCRGAVPSISVESQEVQGKLSMSCT